MGPPPREVVQVWQGKVGTGGLTLNLNTATSNMHPNMRQLWQEEQEEWQERETCKCRGYNTHLPLTCKLPARSPL